MVCSRCIMVVRDELEKVGLHPISIDLGVVELREGNIALSTQKELLKNLQGLGFDIIEDRKSRTIERIKNVIVDLVHHQDKVLPVNLSEYLSQELAQQYSSLSALFSEVTNTTIEKYFISQKIERVKELLMYDEMTLSEIAHKLHYSSVSYLSNQFKKVTGFPPSYYKHLKDKKRKRIEDL